MKLDLEILLIYILWNSAVKFSVEVLRLAAVKFYDKSFDLTRLPHILCNHE